MAEAREGAEEEQAEKPIEQKPVAEMTKEERSAAGLVKKNEGNELFKAKSYADAIAAYTAAIELDATEKTFFNNRAMCYAAMEEWEKCLLDASAALAIDKFPKAFFYKIKSLLNLERFEECEEALAEAMEMYPDSSVITGLADALDAAKPPPPRDLLAEAEEKRLEGNELYKAGKYAQAIPMYTAGLELVMQHEQESSSAPSEGTETRVKLLSNRAAALLMNQKAMECREDCEAVLAIDPKNSKVRGRLAITYLAFEQFEDARKQLSDANVDQSAVKNQWDQITNAENAVIAADRALSNDEGTMALQRCFDAERYGVTAAQSMQLRFAKAFLAVKQYDRALTKTQQIIRAAPSCVDALYLRAETVWRENTHPFDGMFPEKWTNQIDNAMQLLKRALSFDPDHSECQRARKRMKLVMDQIKLAKQAVNNREFESAKDYYSTALNADPQNVRLNAKIYAERAKANLRLKEYTLAMKDASSATYNDHKLQGAYLTKAQAYQGLGKWEECVKELESLVRWTGDEAHEKKLEEAKFQMRKANRPDFYAMLGIPSIATASEIKKGFRETATKCHPDKCAPDATDEERKEAEENFKKLNEACEILSDPETKELYDKGHDLESIKEEMEKKKARCGGGFPGGFNFGFPGGFSKGAGKGGFPF